ncbi:hypothetical protein B5D80_29935 [Micromonospora wenchangensis]|uniref:Uncharacterized protein n=1 Tax=Micromonospora wenchangensis TaxID=1185415 RepID=A0A246RDN1_9ACTN|nr:hypothetical protein B5D80_29935 [Micromonospora wenchangensis]
MPVAPGPGEEGHQLGAHRHPRPGHRRLVGGRGVRRGEPEGARVPGQPVDQDVGGRQTTRRRRAGRGRRRPGSRRSGVAGPATADQHSAQGEPRQPQQPAAARPGHDPSPS